jgi:methyl-accepting chemotaxis protein
MKHVPIVIKFASIMALFGLFSIGIAAYSASRITYTDSAYTELLTHQNRAALMLARANRSMQMARAAIADLMMSRTEESNLAAKAALDSATQSFTQRMDGAITADPANPDIPKLKAEGLEILTSTCARVVQRSLSATAADDVKIVQDEFMKECQPSFGPYTKTSTEITDGILKESDTKSADLSAAASTTALMTLGGVVIGLGIVLVIGFFAITGWIIRPVQRLQSAMLTLAGGDLTVAIPGTDRRDEIGGMAGTVQTFKENALHSVQMEKDADAGRVTRDAERQRTTETERVKTEAMAQATGGLAQGLQRLAAGDISFTLDRPFAAEFEGLRTDFNSALSQLRETLSAVA